MKKIASIFILVIVFATLTQGQEAILLDPKPVYVYPSNVGPCGDPNSPVNNGVFPPEVVNYGTLNISTSYLSPQHPENPRCRFSLAETMDQSEFDKGLMYEFPCDPDRERTGTDFLFTVWYDVYVNETLPLYLQFVYSVNGGSYYSCGLIYLKSSDVVVPTLKENVSFDTNATSNQVDYYKQRVPENQFFTLEVTSPDSGPLYAAAQWNDFPKINHTALELTAPAGTTTVATTLLSPIPSTTFVAVATNSTSGSYSIAAYYYSGIVRFTDPTPQISDSLVGPGKKLYWTENYSSVVLSKIIIVNSTNMNAKITIDQSTNGTNWGSYVVTSKGSVCGMLGQEMSARYISVQSDVATSYTLSIVNGNCEGSNQDNESSIASSIAVVGYLFVGILSFLLL